MKKKPMLIITLAATTILLVAGMTLTTANFIEIMNINKGDDFLFVYRTYQATETEMPEYKIVYIGDGDEKEIITPTLDESVHPNFNHETFWGTCGETCIGRTCNMMQCGKPTMSLAEGCLPPTAEEGHTCGMKLTCAGTCNVECWKVWYEIAEIIEEPQ